MIIISDNIYNALDVYSQYLVEEGLTSQTRADEKVDLILHTLNKNIGGMITHRVSQYLNFGKNERYHLYVYTDPKSKTQWGFNYELFGEDEAIVHQMRNMKLVTNK